MVRQLQQYGQTGDDPLALMGKLVSQSWVLHVGGMLASRCKRP